MNFDQHVVDVDLDGGESEEFAGARTGITESTVIETVFALVSKACRSSIERPLHGKKSNAA
jgi:hypothetical protein